MFPGIPPKPEVDVYADPLIGFRAMSQNPHPTETTWR